MTYQVFQDLQRNNAVKEHVKLVLSPGPTQVWYSRENVGNLTLKASERFDPDNPEVTHVRIASIAGNDPEAIFMAMQGEMWSPKGEANQYLDSVNVSHTSMSCGDVLVIAGVPYVCMPIGWETVESRSQRVCREQAQDNARDAVRRKLPKTPLNLSIMGDMNTPY